MIDAASAGAGPRSQLWRWARRGGGALIVAVILQRVGADPFLDGLRRVDAAALVAATGLTVMTTVVSAWRWRLIARGLGLEIPLGRAVASYYRSQFLNSTLPGGVLGDVHRGVRTGAEAHDLSRSLRSVAWDRAAGQIVQIVLATVTLSALASPVQPVMAVFVGVGVVAAALAASVLLVLPRRRPAVPGRFVQAVIEDGRAALVTRHAWPAIFVASALVVAGHVGVFLVAATADGSPASVRQLLPLAMLVLLSMSVPLTIGGWGPREGVAAWAFALAGLGAAHGVAIATTYGVLSLVATFPGAVVLIAARRAVHHATVPVADVARSVRTTTR